MILQLRHATFSTQSLKEIHSGRETGLIDTGPLGRHVELCIFFLNYLLIIPACQQLGKVSYMLMIRFKSFQNLTNYYKLCTYLKTK